MDEEVILGPLFKSLFAQKWAPEWISTAGALLGNVQPQNRGGQARAACPRRESSTWN